MATNRHESTQIEIIHKDLAYRIVGLAMEVYNELGYGFLEKVYENAMMIQFTNTKISAAQQEQVPVYFRDKLVGHYVADILVEDKIILELKAAQAISNAHRAQALNYLKATGLRLAIILNFAKEKLEYERLVM